tara:strand:+ start:463 stop:921 length:459 start_codon:yes stop_codon:yes gene_type:complete
MYIVELEEEYGYRKYLWKPAISLEALIKSYTELDDPSRFFFSALGIVRELGGQICTYDFEMDWSSCPPTYHKFLRSSWRSMGQQSSAEDSKELIVMSDEEIEAAFGTRKIYMHLHWDDDSYLRVGENYYYAKNYTGHRSEDGESEDGQKSDL